MEESEEHSGDTFLKNEDTEIKQDEKLNNGKRRTPQRTEPSLEASEFYTSTGNQKVKLHQLVGTFKNKASLGEIKKKLTTVKRKSKTLATPLSKQDQERVQRSIAYDATKEEVSKWEPIVKQNRKAEQITFPLNQPDLGLESGGQFVQRFQPRTTLELEISKALRGSEHIFTKSNALTKAEEKALQALSLEEARERRAELQKFRTLLSYKEAKQRRQNKIKSKKYHRIKRKEELRKDKKNLNDLQVHDPEAFAEKLVQLEKERVQERISLKHKGGSRNMKKKMAFSKYDDQTRQALQEMLEKNKELTQKTQQESSSDEEATEYITDPNEKPSLNPWMTHGAPKESVHLKAVGATRGFYKKPEAIKNPDVEIKETKKMDIEDVQSDSSDEGDLIKSSLTLKRRYEDFDENVSDDKIPSTGKKKRKEKKTLAHLEDRHEANEKKNNEYIDPRKVLSISGEKIKTSGVSVVMEGGESIDNIEEHEDPRMTIAQAFADDDIIDEFSQEKSTIEERDKPKDMDLTLPGWGDWGGMGIQHSKKKKVPTATLR